jgi:cell division protein FtsQ
MKGALAMRIVGWGVALTLVLLPLVGLLEGWFAVGRWPVRSLRVDAPFQHVSADQIRHAAIPLLAGGFFAVDLDHVQKVVAALPWVAHVEVRKRWPDQVELRVHEQQAFARWNGSSLINRQGEVFNVPAVEALQGLPDLGGPSPRMREVLGFYLDSQRAFAHSGRRVVGAHLSERGAWSLELDGGAEVVVGRTRATQRLARFVDTYPKLMAGHEQSFEYADLRYSNGYAVRWPPAPTPGGDASKS